MPEEVLRIEDDHLARCGKGPKGPKGGVSGVLWVSEEHSLGAPNGATAVWIMKRLCPLNGSKAA